ncbi:DUF2178 domain-containing protein [Candidatus Nomurabacteria bacterium]|nr:DUF2178 domain-containing protein [Candidatus Nomurabacteria bacterium]
MTKKQYLIMRFSIVVLLSASIAISINLKNYYLPIILMLIALLTMVYFRKQLKPKDVLADERDYQVAGIAARYTLFIYSWFSVIAMFIFLMLSEKYPQVYPLSQFFAFTVCGLLLLNAFLFKWLIKHGK